jgi:hypothetical protein
MIPLAISLFAAAIALGAVASKRVDEALQINRRLNLPARGNALVPWRRA